jgi:SNF2 family DNA or RNA helicase
VLTIKDLIYIGDDIDIADVAEEVFDDEDSTELVDDLSDNIKINSGKRTKYTALIDIINGESVIEDRRVDLHIPNMMKGANYLPEVSIRKVLIFANFEETLQEVVKVLDTNKILYWRLAGGVNEIADTSFKFTECKKTCAMVINSSKHCAGLNLQTATDLVFAHRMIDQAVESQVAGRGHRLGRTSPLNIWYLMYENEYTELKVSHSVRELTDIEIKQERAREAGTEKALINTVRDNAEYGFTHNK